MSGLDRRLPHYHLTGLREGADYTENKCYGKKTYKTRVVGGEMAEDLFDWGLCLPSGTQVTEKDLGRVIENIRKCHRRLGNFV